MRASARTDVVIVGAGLAGLHAASLLEAQGLGVQVVEAQARVGGRIHSMRQLGSNAEAGGTYIGAGYRRVIDAADRLGVELIDVTPLLEFFREQDLALGSQIIPQSAWAEHPANPFPAQDKHILPWMYHRVLATRDNPLAVPQDWLDARHAALDVSARSWMQARGLQEGAIRVGYDLNASFGMDAGDVSALLLLFRAAFSREQRQLAPAGAIGYTARNGVQSLPEAMAAALRGDIHFSRRVIALETSAAEVQVACADGTSYRARHAVCSLPVGVLRHVAIHPPLPGVQAEAIAQVGVQPLTQVYLAPKTRFWEQDGYAPSLFTDSAAGMVAATRSGANPAEVTGITAWAMGANAARLDALPALEAGQRVLQALELIRPAARGQLELIGLKSWGRDPEAGGAWAYFRPGQIRRFAAAMGRPHGRVHFCGEHLAVADRGMEAALESAERAASAVLALQ